MRLLRRPVETVAMGGTDETRETLNLSILFINKIRVSLLLYLGGYRGWQSHQSHVSPPWGNLVGEGV